MSNLRKITRPARHFLVYIILTSVFIFVNCIPRTVSLALFSRLAVLAARVFTKDKRVSVSNIVMALSVSDEEAERIYFDTFSNYVKSIIDLCLVSGRCRNLPSKVVDISDEDRRRMHSYFDDGKGVLGLTAHYSNWELLGGYIASELGDIYVIAHSLFDRRVDGMLNWMRRRVGITAIKTDEPASIITNHLRGGAFVGILADQNIPSLPGVYVQFFGMKAYTPVGPALMALRSGAVFMPIHITRTENNRYRITVDEQIELNRDGKLREQLAVNTQLWTDIVEEWIRDEPGQWVWLHNRWDNDDTESD